MTTDDAAGRHRRAPDLDMAVVVRRALSTLEGTAPGLAREAGLPPRRLARIRRGEARPTHAEVAALADALSGRTRADEVDPGRADLAQRVLRMALEMGADGSNGGGEAPGDL